MNERMDDLFKKDAYMDVQNGCPKRYPIEECLRMNQTSATWSAQSLVQSNVDIIANKSFNILHNTFLLIYVPTDNIEVRYGVVP